MTGYNILPVLRTSTGGEYNRDSAISGIIENVGREGREKFAVADLLAKKEKFEGKEVQGEKIKKSSWKKINTKLQRDAA